MNVCPWRAKNGRRLRRGPPCHGVRLKVLILQAGLEAYTPGEHGRGLHTHRQPLGRQVMRQTHDLTAKRPWTKGHALSTI
jgi:hypothetical protein